MIVLDSTENLGGVGNSNFGRGVALETGMERAQRLRCSDCDRSYTRAREAMRTHYRGIWPWSGGGGVKKVFLGKTGSEIQLEV